MSNNINNNVSTNNDISAFRSNLVLPENRKVKEAPLPSIDKYRSKMLGTTTNFVQVSKQCAVKETTISLFSKPEVNSKELVKRVNEQLAKNVGSVSKNFINENSEKIVQGFKAQLGILEKVLKELNEKAKAFEKRDPDKLSKEEKETVKNIAAAIVEIDEKIGRLGKDRIGGFQKKLPSGEKTEETDTPKNRTGFDPITKCDAEVIKQYENAVKTVEDATSELNKADLSGYKKAKERLNDAKKALKDFEAEQLKPEVIKKNLQILKDNT